MTTQTLGVVGRSCGKERLKLHHFPGRFVGIVTLAILHNMSEGGQHRPRRAVLKVDVGRFAPLIQERTQQASADQSLFPSPQHNGLGSPIGKFAGLQLLNPLSFECAVVGQLTDSRSNALTKTIRAEPSVSLVMIVLVILAVVID